MAEPIMPPNRQFKRARSWKMFERLFKPTRHPEDGFCPLQNIPHDADQHHYWTVIDHMMGNNTCHLSPGFHFTNSMGFIHCAVPWGGDANDHPEYVY